MLRDKRLKGIVCVFLSIILFAASSAWFLLHAKYRLISNNFLKNYNMAELLLEIFVCVLIVGLLMTGISLIKTKGNTGILKTAVLLKSKIAGTVCILFGALSIIAFFTLIFVIVFRIGYVDYIGVLAYVKIFPVYYTMMISGFLWIVMIFFGILLLKKNSSRKLITALAAVMVALVIVKLILASHPFVKKIKLQTAIINNNPAAVEKIIRSGIDINEPPKMQESGLLLLPLDMAVGLFREEIVRILIANGADVNDISSGMTPLSSALEYSLHGASSDIFKLLVENGADVNAKSSGGFTVLMSAVLNPDMSKNDAEEIVNLLIARGADVNAASEGGVTVLMAAAANKERNEDIVKILIDAGAEVNRRSPDGGSALFFAVRRGNKAICKYLIDSGAEYDIKKRSGRTVLAETVRMEKPDQEILKFLLEDVGGIDVNDKDEDSMTALLYAVKLNNPVDIGILELLVEYGADVNIQTGSGMTALLFAAERAGADICEYLINSGALITAKNSFGATPLMLASWSNNKDVVNFFLKKGLDVNEQDIYGRTPVFYAAENNTAEVCEELVRSGAKLDIKAENDMTVLMAAAYHNHRIDVLEFLIKSGLSIDDRDDDGKNALDYLKMNRYMQQDERTGDQKQTDSFFRRKNIEISEEDKEKALKMLTPESK